MKSIYLICFIALSWYTLMVKSETGEELANLIFKTSPLVESEESVNNLMREIFRNYSKSGNSLDQGEYRKSMDYIHNFYGINVTAYISQKGNSSTKFDSVDKYTRDWLGRSLRIIFEEALSKAWEDLIKIENPYEIEEALEALLKATNKLEEMYKESKKDIKGQGGSIFIHFDNDRSQYIDKRELEKHINEALALESEPLLTQREAEKLFNKYDNNGDGKLSVQELNLLLLGFAEDKIIHYKKVVEDLEDKLDIINRIQKSAKFKAYRDIFIMLRNHTNSEEFIKEAMNTSAILGEISKEYFLGFVADIYKRVYKGRGRLREGEANQIFMRFDVDGSGGLNEREFRTGFYGIINEAYAYLREKVVKYTQGIARY